MSKEAVLAAIDSKDTHSGGDFSDDDVRELLLEGKIVPQVDNGEVSLVKNITFGGYEDLRLERLKDILDQDTTAKETIDGFIDKMSYFSIQDRSMVLMENIEGYLLEFPTVTLDPELHELASTAFQALFDFYQLAANREGNFFLNEIELEKK